MDRDQALFQIELALSGVLVPDNAKLAQVACAKALRIAGWNCLTEVSVPERGDGRTGRVDIEARKAGWIAGIEIDRKTTRLKSIAKLNSRSDWLKILVTRGPVTRKFHSVDAQLEIRIEDQGEVQK